MNGLPLRSPYLATNRPWRTRGESQPEVVVLRNGQTPWAAEGAARSWSPRRGPENRGVAPRWGHRAFDLEQGVDEGLGLRRCTWRWTGQPVTCCGGDGGSYRPAHRRPATGRGQDERILRSRSRSPRHAGTPIAGLGRRDLRRRTSTAAAGRVRVHAFEVRHQATKGSVPNGDSHAARCRAGCNCCSLFHDAPRAVVPGRR